MLQELYNAVKPLQQEAEKLREACSIVSSAEFSSEPQYRAAAKVHSFLMDHVVTCDSMSLNTLSRPSSQAFLLQPLMDKLCLYWNGRDACEIAQVLWYCTRGLTQAGLQDSHIK